ncbi:MAG: fatty acid desaturase [Ilumatobacteraceae bacterium]
MRGTTFEQRSITDWPTLAVIAAFWLSFAVLVVNSDHVPSVAVVIALGLLGCFYMSLQHEVIHGHPTRSRRLNWALVGIPLGLVMPFSRYGATHLAHHNSDITNPLDDPESFYVLAETWEHAGRLHRTFLTVNRTLAGRLVLGPAVMAWRSVSFDFPLAARQAEVRLAWLAHVIGSGVVLTVIYQSPLPIWLYLLGFVYIGSSLTSLRSFAEHRVSPGETKIGAPRSAVVRSGRFFGLLFLNNNLHYTHHQLPGAAWFRLPELTGVLDSAAVVADSAGTYDGYGEIVRRYLFRPFEQPVHPMSDSIKA